MLNDNIFVTTHQFQSVHSKDEYKLIPNESRNSVTDKKISETRNKRETINGSTQIIDELKIDNKCLELPKLQILENQTLIANSSSVKKRDFAQKLASKLKNCLAYLFYNNITIKTFLNDNPFPKKPLSKPSPIKFNFRRKKIFRIS